MRPLGPIEAGWRLAEALKAYRGARPLVISAPRAPLALARTLAGELGGDMDVLLMQHIAAPGHPECDLGVVTETGDVQMSRDACDTCLVDQDRLAGEILQAIESLLQKRGALTPDQPPADPRGRIVILTSAAAASGRTLLAILEALRAHSPVRLIAAVVSAPPEAVRLLRTAADEVACLTTCSTFGEVGRTSRWIRPPVESDTRRELRAASAPPQR